MGRTYKYLLMKMVFVQVGRVSGFEILIKFIIEILCHLPKLLGNIDRLPHQINHSFLMGHWYDEIIKKIYKINIEMRSG